MSEPGERRQDRGQYGDQGYGAQGYGGERGYPDRDYQEAGRGRGPSDWAIGGVILAASLMILLGIWGILVGIAAIASDAIFITTSEYTYGIDLGAWGWIHLILGVVSLLAGLGLFTGATWARVVGIVLAVLVAINYFLFLPFYPIWSISVIVLSVFVIWSLATASPRRLAGR